VAQALRWTMALAHLLLGLVLVWEVATAFGQWSHGWLEGTSYAAAAFSALAAAVLLLRSRAIGRGLLLSWATMFGITGLWFCYWTAWLATTAREIGPVSPLVPGCFALIALCTMGAATLLAYIACKRPI
jgi:hypothetical protein